MPLGTTSWLIKVNGRKALRAANRETSNVRETPTEQIDRNIQLLIIGHSSYQLINLSILSQSVMCLRFTSHVSRFHTKADQNPTNPANH